MKFIGKAKSIVVETVVAFVEAIVLIEKARSWHGKSIESEITPIENEAIRFIRSCPVLFAVASSMIEAKLAKISEDIDSYLGTTDPLYRSLYASEIYGAMDTAFWAFRWGSRHGYNLAPETTGLEHRIAELLPKFDLDGAFESSDALHDRRTAYLQAEELPWIWEPAEAECEPAAESMTEAVEGTKTEMFEEEKEEVNAPEEPVLVAECEDEPQDVTPIVVYQPITPEAEIGNGSVENALFGSIGNMTKSDIRRKIGMELGIVFPEKTAKSTQTPKPPATPSEKLYGNGVGSIKGGVLEAKEIY